MKKIAVLLSIFSLLSSGMFAQVMISINMPDDCAPAAIDLINNSDVFVAQPVWE